MKLSKKTLIIVIAAVSVFLVLFLLYAPLIGKLNKEGAKCRAAELKVVKARSIVGLMKAAKIKKNLVAEEDASLAMDELTGLGKLKQVNFISITPKNLEKKEGFGSLSIEMEIKSTYQQLGAFLGALDDFEKSVVVVEGFRASPLVTGGDELKTELTVNMKFYNDDAK